MATSSHGAYSPSLTVAALAVVVTSWMLTPDLATARNVDPVVLAHLEEQNSMGMLNGFQDIAVAEIDLDAPDPVSLAGLGATDTTPMEVGAGVAPVDAAALMGHTVDVYISTYLRPSETGTRSAASALGAALAKGL